MDNGGELARISSKIEHLQGDHDRLLKIESTMDANKEFYLKLSEALSLISKQQGELKDFIYQMKTDNETKWFDRKREIDTNINRRPTWAMITAIATITVGLIIGSYGYASGIKDAMNEKIHALDSKVYMVETYMNSKK